MSIRPLFEDVEILLHYAHVFCFSTLQLGEVVSKQRIEEREKNVWDGHAASKDLVMNAARELASSDQQMAIIAKLKGLMYDSHLISTSNRNCANVLCMHNKFYILISSPDVDKDKIGPEIMQEIRTGVRMPFPLQLPPSQMPGFIPTISEAGFMPAINMPGSLGSRLPLPGAPMLPMNMAPPPHLQFSGAPHMPSQQPPLGAAPQMQPPFGAMGQVNPVPPLLSSPSPAPPPPPPSQHPMGMGMPSLQQQQQQMRPPGPPMTSASTAPPPPPALHVTSSNAPMVPQPLLSMPTAPPAGLLPSALLPRPPVPLLSLNVQPPAPQVTPEVVAAVEAGVGPEVAASLFHQMQQRGPSQGPMSGIGVIPLPPPPPDEPSAKRARPDAEDAGLNLIPEEEFLARFPVGCNYVVFTL